MSEVLGDAEAQVEISDATGSPSVPEVVCKVPLCSIGIQNNSPVTFSSDGKYCAFVSSSRAIVICTGFSPEPQVKVIHNLGGNVVNSDLYSLAFHPEHPFIASAGEEGIYVWNWKTGALLQHVSADSHAKEAHEGSVFVLDWMYNGEVLVTGGKDAHIK
ncbi:hypothetical protein KIPB_004809, partial [Kipferlia bialata]|eukprot:g4809.t1